MRRFSVTLACVLSSLVLAFTAAAAFGEEESVGDMRRRARELFFRRNNPREALYLLKAAHEKEHEELVAATGKRPQLLQPGVTLARWYEEADDHWQAKTWMEYAVQLAVQGDPQDWANRLAAAQ